MWKLSSDSDDYLIVFYFSRSDHQEILDQKEPR